eukprot:3360359-Amphidinium_carterae.1
MFVSSSAEARQKREDWLEMTLEEQAGLKKTFIMGIVNPEDRCQEPFVKFDPRAWHCIYPKLGEAEWNTLEKCGFNAGLTSDQVISSVRAAFGELTDRDAYLEVLHQIDDTLHEISEHHDPDLKPDEKHPKLDPLDKERHEREGHLPKDSSCPACIRESGSRVT